MYNLIAIIGPSGSGKDTLMNQLLEIGGDKFHKVINHTTRPKREHEVNGINYHFVSEEDFAKMVLNMDMIEATSFNDWFYGTSITSLKEDCINVGVFNPTGLEIIYENCKDIQLIVIYLVVSDKSRLLRQLNREENPNVDEIVRRYQTDKEDFNNFKETTEIPYICANNENLIDCSTNTKTIINYALALLKGNED